MTVRKHRRIGVVVAIEIDAVLARYGKPVETKFVHGYTVRTYETPTATLFVVDSGAGEISAASSTQLLISEYHVDMILNFGVVGSLTPEMSTAELCVVEKVIHYDFDTTGWLNLPRGQYPGRNSAYLDTTPVLVERAIQIAPNLRRAVCASADKFVDRPEDKSNLRNTYAADICEMESAGVVLTCQRNGVPCLLIKAISDSLVGGGKEFFKELERVSKICFNVVDEILSRLDD